MKRISDEKNTDHSKKFQKYDTALIHVYHRYRSERDISASYLKQQVRNIDFAGGVFCSFYFLSVVSVCWTALRFR